MSVRSNKNKGQGAHRLAACSSSTWPRAACSRWSRTGPTRRSSPRADISRRHRRRRRSRPPLLDQYGRCRAATTAPSSAATSTDAIARRSCLKGATHTPKQLQLDKCGGKLYWCDREGMRVMRANLDGSQIETLVQTGWTESIGATRRSGASASRSTSSAADLLDAKRPDNAGKGRIFRAGIDIPTGETASSSQRHRGALRRPARADRPGDRSRKARFSTGPTAATRRSATP